MIAVQDIVNGMAAGLDAEGSDRYLFDEDYKPAIDRTIDWLVSVFNYAFSQKKLSEENLRDLMKYRLWIASNFSRVNYAPADTGEDLWTVVRVITEPNVYPAGPPVAVTTTSVYVPEKSYVGGGKNCDRLSAEEWTEKDTNIFLSGNGSFTNGLSRPAYLSFSNYSSQAYTGGAELEIAPSQAGKFVCIGYLKVPTKPATINDNVEFPATMLNLFVEKGLNFISLKQGDNTTLYSVTEKEVQTLVSILS